MRWVIGDTGEDIGEPSLRVDVVHFCGDDKAVHFRRPLSAAVGTCEQPRFSAQGNSAQRALRGVIGQTDPAIVEEPGEGCPTVEHVVHGLAGIVMRREPGSRGGHPVRQFRDQRRAQYLPHSQAFGGDLPLMSRSISNSASIRRTASSAIGEEKRACPLRFAFGIFVRSASSKNFRLA